MSTQTHGVMMGSYIIENKIRNIHIVVGKIKIIILPDNGQYAYNSPPIVNKVNREGSQLFCIFDRFHSNLLLGKIRT